LFAATFLSGASGLLTDRQFTIFGSQTSPTLQNATLAGSTDSWRVRQNKFTTPYNARLYVRVPAGKQFYFVRHPTIDQTDATVGQSRSIRAKSKRKTNRAVANPYGPAAFAYPKGPMP